MKYYNKNNKKQNNYNKQVKNNINYIKNNAEKFLEDSGDKIDKDLEFPSMRERKELIRKLLTLCESAYGAVYKEREGLDDRTIGDGAGGADSGIELSQAMSDIKKYKQDQKPLKSNNEWSCKDGTPLRAVLEIGELVHKLFVAEEKIYQDKIKVQNKSGQNDREQGDDLGATSALRQAGVVDEDELEILEDFIRRRNG